MSSGLGFMGGPGMYTGPKKVSSNISIHLLIRCGLAGIGHGRYGWSDDHGPPLIVKATHSLSMCLNSCEKRMQALKGIFLNGPERALKSVAHLRCGPSSFWKSHS